MSTPSLAECVATIKAAGISFTRIAEEAGCDTSTIYRIRKGAISDPRDSVASKLRALAERYGQASARVAA